jgi:hypothetical protein
VSARRGPPSALAVVAASLGAAWLAACTEPVAVPDQAPATAPATVAPAASEAEPASVPAAPRPATGPQLLDPASVGVGAPAPDVGLFFQSLDGVDLEPTTLHALCREAPGVVVLFTTLRCPVSRLYAPSFGERARRWAERGVRTVVVDPDPKDGPGLAERASEQEWPTRVVHDADRKVAVALGATRTTEALLLDEDGVVRYRGAIDDQYGLGDRRPAPTARYLEDAVKALLDGRTILPAATSAPGCLFR